jgi:hypothetical protein
MDASVTVTKEPAARAALAGAAGTTAARRATTNARRAMLARVFTREALAVPE